MMIDCVRRALQRPLPGLSAQARMAPPYRREMVGTMLNPPADCKQAGVLVLLYPHGGELCFPLTRRPDHVEFHKGQISLPGGSRENAEPLRQTALRETQEEIGVQANAVEVLGALSPLYVPPSNFCVRPFVGHVARRPDFDLQAVEVVELIEARLAALLDPATIREEDWELHGGTWRIPFYQFGPHKVWGATAMILAEFQTVLEGIENDRDP